MCRECASERERESLAKYAKVAEPERGGEFSAKTQKIENTQ